MFEMLAGYHRPAVDRSTVDIFRTHSRIVTKTMIEVKYVKLLKVRDTGGLKLGCGPSRNGGPGNEG